MFRSLDVYSILLGQPAYRGIVGDDAGSKVAAHWECGCTATGPSFTRMSLKTCDSHRVGRVAVPPLAAI